MFELKLALSSTQALAFYKLCRRTGLGVDVVRTSLRLIIGSGASGMNFWKRIASAFFVGPFSSALIRFQDVLGKAGFFMVFLKAGILFCKGEWGSAFAEIAKGIVCVGIPLFAFIDAIFCLLEIVIPGIQGYPLYRFFKAFNPADLIGDSIKTVLAVCEIVFTAAARNDWNILDKFRDVKVPELVSWLKWGIEKLLDSMGIIWRAIQWLLEVISRATGIAASVGSPGLAIA